MGENTGTKVNGGLVIREPEGGILFGTDALLLADFSAKTMRKGKCLDLGTGSGVIPLLLLASGCRCDFLGLELQEKHALFAKNNAEENGFSERFSVLLGNAEDYRTLFESGSFDYVVTNPPYMRKDCGKNNESLALDIARREVFGGIELFCKTASWALKSGGNFYAVYRPDRLVTLLSAMRENRIEPKRIRFVVPSVGKKPSLVLVEGKKDGKEELSFEPNLYVYKDSSHKEESKEIEEIYQRFGAR